MKRVRKLFARNLKRLRKANGISQEKLAEKMSLSTRYIQRLEGKNCPSVGLDSIALLAQALRAKPKDLLEEES